MKVLLLLLALALPAISQSLPDISKFEFVGTSDGGKIGAFVNRKDAKRDGPYATFDGLLGVLSDGTHEIEPDNFIISTFRANCTTNAFAINHTKGIIDGKVIDRDEEPSTNVAEKGLLVYSVIRRVCDGPNLKDLSAPKAAVKYE